MRNGTSIFSGFCEGLRPKMANFSNVEGVLSMTTGINRSTGNRK